jgi:hypothetical protein
MTLDLDSPLDLLLLARDPGCPTALIRLAADVGTANPGAVAALDGVAAKLEDRRAEVVLAGRTSARTLRWLEQNTACRVRAFVEERGLRAGSPLALGAPDAVQPPGDEAAVRRSGAVQLRPPRSLLGLLLDARGPEALGDILAELGDAAVVDTRVLLAHRLGADETAWPTLDDRLASDLLRPDEIADPWLQSLTRAAVRAPIPVLLGGHTLVGPGLPLLPPRAAGRAT